MQHLHKHTYSVCFLFEDKKDYPRSFFPKLGAIIKIILIEFVENIKLLTLQPDRKIRYMPTGHSQKTAIQDSYRALTHQRA